MNIAIHHRKGSYSERWVIYCEENNINYKIVNCFDNDIITQLEGFDILLWHHHHEIFKDTLVAKNILFSLEHVGKIVYPDWKTQWHFDDKVAQKYLLEASGVPLVPSFVFYDKKEALNWAKEVSFPKVFKLKGGAGSKNVLLIKDFNTCKRFINKAFGKGFLQHTVKNAIKDDLLRFKKNKKPIDLLKAIGRFFIKPEYANKQSRERGYVYFQEFIENDGYDIRVLIIDNKAVSVKRLVRENDFRASGSGNLIFENENIDKEILKLAFDISEKLSMQSISIDFIKQKADGKYFIVEISYGFPMKNFLDKSEGFWNKNLEWNKGAFNLQHWILNSLINEVNNNN